MQLSLHNCPRDIREALFRWGNTVAFRAVLLRAGIGNCPLFVDDIVVASGRMTVTELSFLMSVKTS